jgi:fluoride exporter
MTGLAALAVFGGAGVGACLRWVLGLWLNPLLPGMPLGTLAANLLGGLLVGVATAGLAQLSHLAPEWRLLLVTGFLGGLTTFSTFSAEVVSMLVRHQWGWAFATALTHLAGSLLLTCAGIALVHLLAPRLLAGGGAV